MSSFLPVLRGIAESLTLFALLLFTLGNIAVAHSLSEKGVLDTPAAAPATGNGNAAQPIPSQAQAAQQMKEHKKALRTEQRDLKKKNREQLTRLAKNGERAAQLVLAEDFANEANSESITVASGNAALSDAASWYNLAAQRGFPGSHRIDGALPLFSLRSIRPAD